MLLLLMMMMMVVEGVRYMEDHAAADDIAADAAEGDPACIL